MNQPVESVLFVMIYNGRCVTGQVQLPIGDSQARVEGSTSVKIEGWWQQSISLGAKSAHSYFQGSF